MSSGISRELQFFGLAVLRGVFILVLYDLLRIFRRVLPHGVWAIALEDVLYWIATALLIFQLLYRENDGAVRGYALLAVASGMVLYHQTFSNFLENSTRSANCHTFLQKEIEKTDKRAYNIFILLRG